MNIIGGGLRIGKGKYSVKQTAFDDIGFPAGVQLHSLKDDCWPEKCKLHPSIFLNYCLDTKQKSLLLRPTRNLIPVIKWPAEIKVSGNGGIPEWPNGTDCNSVVARLRRFESFSPHLCFQGHPKNGWFHSPKN